MPKTKSEKRRVKEPTAPGGGQVHSRDTGYRTRGTQGQPGVESRSDLANLEKLAGASTPDQRGRGGLRRLSRLSRARSASQSWTGRVRVARLYILQYNRPCFPRESLDDLELDLDFIA